MIPTNGRATQDHPRETRYTRHEVTAPRVVGPSGRTTSPRPEELRGDLQLRFFRLRCRKVENGGEPAAGIAGGVGRNLFGGAGGDDLAAAATALRPHVNHPVCGFDDVQIV